MNECFRNLNRIEVLVTMACTGRCRHCQNGDPDGRSAHVDANAVEKAIREVSAHYPIVSLMTFGGEPLLYPDTVCRIHQTGRDLGIPRRQLITNGFFSRDPETIRDVARQLKASGVNDLLLSVDAFHQEVIPLEPVLVFAESVVRAEIPTRLQPAWLVSPEDNNPYNLRTREVLRAFADLPIPEGSGNVIFLSGNARKYLAEYFPEDAADVSPYDEDPRDIKSLSIEADGTVLGRNLYETDVLEILREYRPEGGGR